MPLVDKTSLEAAVIHLVLVQCLLRSCMGLNIELPTAMPNGNICCFQWESWRYIIIHQVAPEIIRLFSRKNAASWKPLIQNSMRTV